MKLRFNFIALVFLIFMVWNVAAQVSTVVTNTPTGETNQLAPFVPAEGAVPATKEEFWRFAISIITLGLLQIAKKIPRLPNWLLPIFAPFVGMALGFGLRALGQLNLGWVDMGLMGGLATWIHQLAIQVAQRDTDPTSQPKT